MADRDPFDPKGDEQGQLPPSDAVAETTATTKPSSDLPDVESPSISPAVSQAVPVEEEPIEPKPEPEIEAAKYASLRALVPVTKSTFDNEPPFEPIETEEPRRRSALKPRHWRTMRLAAAIALAAGFGAIAGGYAIGNFAEPPKVDTAVQDENKAMQQSLVKMSKELTTLKTQLEVSAKQAEGRTASLEKRISDKVNERINERFHRAAAAASATETTGSIAAAQPAISAPAVTTADVPIPRPAPRLAMAQPQTANTVSTTAGPTIVRDWSVKGARNGFVYVEGRNGEIYQVVPGAPLPGLGPVGSIRRMDGRWIVTTPKGIIVSMQDRRFN